MKKLWETKTFDNKEGESRSGRALAAFSRNFLTILLGLFLLMILGILCVVLYTSNGGGDKEKSNQAFFDPNKPSTSVVNSQSVEENEEDTTEAEGETETPASNTVTLSSAQAARLSQEAENQAQNVVEQETIEQTQIVSQGGTDSVIAGEGAASIAARNGISLETLYALNPDKMTGPGGTWWANPGDVVVVN